MPGEMFPAQRRDCFAGQPKLVDYKHLPLALVSAMYPALHVGSLGIWILELKSGIPLIRGARC